MEFSLVRAIGTAALSVALIGASAPVHAVEPDQVVATVNGHVTDRDGNPLEGIHVAGGCPCDDYSPERHTAGSDITDATGFYSFKVLRIYADQTYFTDPDQNYFEAGPLSGTTTTITGNTVTIDAKLMATSRIIGTVTAVNGGRALGTPVIFYDAKTGERSGQTGADKTGRFEMILKKGDYRLRFGGGYYSNAQWYGGAATKEESPVVSVGYGRTITRIDQTVTPKPTVWGRITIDGKPMLGSVKERLVLTVTDGTGAQLGPKYLPSKVFSLVELHPGELTLNFRPTTGSSGWIEPFTQKIYLPPGTAMDGLAIDLPSNAASATSTRSTSVNFKQSSKGIAAAGKKLAGKIVMRSYGNVAGGRIAIYVNGEKVDARDIPASGRVNWSYTPKRVVVGKFSVRVKYFGTETTRSNSSIIYDLYGP